MRGETLVAHMRPTNPAALDVRTRKQAQAVVTSAEAALRVARADLNAAFAKRDLAETELTRAKQLVERGISSQARLDSARQAVRVAQASFDTAEAAISMREAEIANAQAQLISFTDPRLTAAIGMVDDNIPLYAAARGRILRVIQESETSLPAGTPIREIGNIENDLEVVIELLSTDVVQVAVGDPVIIANWGRPAKLSGEVIRVDPFGTTQFSALGVEEQRVNAVVAFVSPSEDYAGLGHGFRAESQIVVWQAENVLIVPASALFRSRDAWAVFVAIDGAAQLCTIEIGPNNGVEAQVTGGLSDGDRVSLYPSSGLSEGMRVTERVVN